MGIENIKRRRLLLLENLQSLVGETGTLLTEQRALEHQEGYYARPWVRFYNYRSAEMWIISPV